MPRAPQGGMATHVVSPGGQNSLPAKSSLGSVLHASKPGHPTVTCLLISGALSTWKPIQYVDERGGQSQKPGSPERHRLPHCGVLCQGPQLSGHEARCSL